MSSSPENHLIEQQCQILRAAIDGLHEKLDVCQTQLASELAALREELQPLAQKIEAPPSPTDQDQRENDQKNNEGQPQAGPPSGEEPPVDSVVPRPGELNRTAEHPQAPPPPDDIQNVLLGSLLAGDAADVDRNQIMRGIHQNDAATLALVGQIMVFRGTSPERRPQLLKDIGETYYRWRGAMASADDHFRDQLVGYLVSQCEASGMPVAIELVQVGDRYDAKRHQAKQRGVEVASVGGWVVLRDSGTVYTKATVVVK